MRAFPIKTGITLFVCVWLNVLWPRSATAAAAELSDTSAKIVSQQAGIWKSCTNESGSVSSRDLFAYALALCESHQHPERLDSLFQLAARMQDRDPHNRTYGNFWWNLRDGRVMDNNAVDFCMRAGALIWLKHRDDLPQIAREHLLNLLDTAISGCLRHKVDPSYSNIAIMNAGDLILLGEALAKPQVTAEGCSRLDHLYEYISTSGIHEYNSPTYTGVDLDGLGLIATYATNTRAQSQADSLLKLFWTDVALNWFPPNPKG